MNQNMETQYKTKDIYEASYLLTCGAKLSNLEPTPYDYFLFVLKGDNLDALVEKYWTRQSQIDAYSLFQNFQYLRDLIKRKEMK